ncbi:hypothetical protein PQQ84_33735 [Paraburkholderia strydomiana]
MNDFADAVFGAGHDRSFWVPVMKRRTDSDTAAFTTAGISGA